MERVYTSEAVHVARIMFFRTIEERYPQILEELARVAKPWLETPEQESGQLRYVDPVEDWAKKRHLTDPWCLAVVHSTRRDWAYDGEPNGKWSLSPYHDWPKPSIHISDWPEGAQTYREAEKAVRRLVQEHLDALREKHRLRIKDDPHNPRVYRWLVRRQLLGHRFGAIADEEPGQTRGKVERAATNLANYLGLTLREPHGPGRPKK